MRTVEAWKLVLRAALRDALRAKDTTSLSVIRETLAAIDNAEAADLSQAPVTRSEVIAGAADGLGAGDIARRELGPDEVTTIIEREMQERRDSAASYASLGRPGEAATLVRQAEVLQRLLGTSAEEAPTDEQGTDNPRPRPHADVRRGDLFWIALGAEPAHSHPHVVVQDDVFNRSRIKTVIVCALTTNLGKASEPGNVLLDVGEGGLPKQSVVVVSQIDSVDKARLGERIGTLSQERVDQILSGLRFQ